MLKEQLLKIQNALEQLEGRIAYCEKQIRQASSQDRMAALSNELRNLKEEWKLLDKLLHGLAKEAKAAEWTAIDEALKRVRGTEQQQELADKRKEILQERQNERKE